MEEIQGKNRGKTVGASLWEWIKVIAIALLISLPIRYFLAEPFVVNGASMDPTFATGQFLIVDRISYRAEEPERGDVIVFKYPNNPSVYYIKRIIGLPGDTLTDVNGKVHVSNKDNPSGFDLDETYVNPVHRSYESFKTTLNDGQYFVMGDNRAQSSDSRVWGILDRKLIVGRVFLRLWPFQTLSVFPGEKNE